MTPFKKGKADLNRLKVIQEAMDQFTQEVITGVSPAGGRSLEIGAGAGSIARWLATRNPHGTVEAVDITVDNLQDDLPDNLTVTQADISESTYPEAVFDLIHARFVLSHLPNRDELVKKISSWLRPGGHLVITEPYQLPPSTSPHKVVQKVLEAYASFVARGGMSLDWVRAVGSTHRAVCRAAAGRGCFRAGPRRVLQGARGSARSGHSTDHHHRDRAQTLMRASAGLYRNPKSLRVCSSLGFSD